MHLANEKATARYVSSSLHPSVLGATLVVALMTAAIVAVGARDWIGTPFPGFFVLGNRVVASVGRADWPASQAAIYQRTIVAVDATPVVESADIYRHVAARAAGTAFTYALGGGAHVETLTLPSRPFSQADYWTIFGGYVLTGLLYFLLALLGAWQARDASLARALMLVGSVGGIYALSAVELYDPDASMRIHALAEAFLPATFVHLALVFPRVLPTLTRPAVAVAWWLSLALAVPYQLLLNQPDPYSAIHGVCELYLGAAGIALAVRLIVARAQGEAGPALSGALAGAVLGLGVPAIVFTISGASGGRLPVNTCTTTAFLFPLCFAYGLVRARFAEHPHGAVMLADASD